MRIGAVGDAGLAQVANVVQILFDLLVAAGKVQRHLLHVMETAVRTHSTADVVNSESAGFPLLPHLNKPFGRRILSTRPEAYPGYAELRDIHHMLRRRMT